MSLENMFAFIAKVQSDTGLYLPIISSTTFHTQHMPHGVKLEITY